MATGGKSLIYIYAKAQIRHESVQMTTPNDRTSKPLVTTTSARINLTPQSAYHPLSQHFDAQIPPSQMSGHAPTSAESYIVMRSSPPSEAMPIAVADTAAGA
jgi:hypothetical protein